MVITRKTYWTFTLLICLGIMLGGCNRPQTGEAVQAEIPGIQANMIFFYYQDLDQAVDFYHNLLGFTQVLDYGFAKAFRISETSYICLVDETKGMHDASEPKTVTLSFITEEVEGWYQHLQENGIEMHSPLGDATRHPTRGFVALDPEGYFLEFETFLDHEQNVKLRERLAATTALYSSAEDASSRPENLGIQGNIFWLYYKDIPAAQNFYQDNLGLEMLVDQGIAKVYTSSSTAFVGLVDEAKGLHHFSEKKSVNIGFFTNQVDDWYQLLLDKGLHMRSPLGDAAEQDRVRAFVTFDSAGYYLEFDSFLEHEDHAELLRILRQPK